MLLCFIPLISYKDNEQFFACQHTSDMSMAVLPLSCRYRCGGAAVFIFQPRWIPTWHINVLIVFHATHTHTQTLTHPLIDGDDRKTALSTLALLHAIRCGQTNSMIIIPTTAVFFKLVDSFSFQGQSVLNIRTTVHELSYRIDNFENLNHFTCQDTLF